MNEAVDIKIVDFAGQVVFEQEKINVDLEIPTSEWNTGLYIITITQGNVVLQINKCFLIK